MPEVVTLCQLFKINGWFSARAGKIHHFGNPGRVGTPGLDDPPSWDMAVNPAGRDKLTDGPDIIQYTGKPRDFGSSLSWSAPEGADSDHTDGKAADEAIRLMEESSEATMAIISTNMDCGESRPVLRKRRGCLLSSPRLA